MTSRSTAGSGKGSGSAGGGVRRPWATPSPALATTCSSCGACGGDRAGVADLEVTWLLPDPAGSSVGGVAAARFCRDCRPTGAVGELACAGCGDGPLLAGDLAAVGDLATAAAIDAWLTATGWRPAGPWCPGCTRIVHPARARSSIPTGPTRSVVPTARRGSGA